MTDASEEHAAARYLSAKRSVDDRARDRRVKASLLDALPATPRVLEAGSGAGFAMPTLLEWGLEPASYAGVDADAGVVSFARWMLPRLLRRRGYGVTATERGCRLESDAPVGFETGDALERLPKLAPAGGADLLIAQSFFDLVPLEEALDAFERALAPDGLVYAPSTFDGETIFLPEHPADAAVIEAFHADMDGDPGRDSRVGRHLIDGLRHRGATLEAVGASDWIVRPTPTAGRGDGPGYRADERHFLATILGFVADAAADVEGGSEWAAQRRAQLAAGELSYVAHGYDLLWRPRADA